MTTKDEALKLALEALETVRHKIDSYQVNVCDDVDEAITAIREALAQPEGCQCPACKIAPHASDCAVHNAPAWPNGPCDCGVQSYPDNFIDALKYDVAKRDSEAQQQNYWQEEARRYAQNADFWRSKYESATAQQQEPVAWLIWLHGPAGHFDHKQFAEMEFERRNKEYPDPDRKLLPLYTTPPQRKPLTDEEIILIVADCASSHQHTDIHFARAIEAAHGIKGEA